MLRRLPSDHLAVFGSRWRRCRRSPTSPASRDDVAAAGFTPVGLTARYPRARGRSDYVFHGARNSTGCAGSARAATADLPGLLSSAFDSPLITPGGKGRTDLNKMNINGGAGDGSMGLLEHLRTVTDHRKARGKRHPLEAILVMIAVAKLCGADSVYAIGQYAATMPQQALARCGLRRNTRTGRYHPPSLKTIRRTIKSIDAHAADAALCAWLRQESAAGRVPLRHLAVDGKTVRGARNPAGKAPHLLSAYDVTGGTVAAQLDVGAKRNEITYFADLLACLSDPAVGTGGGEAASGDGDDRGEDTTLITADALHTQTGHVEAMNTAGLDWMLIAKGNQPALEDQICAFDWESFPPQHVTDETGHGRHDVRIIRAAPATGAIKASWPGTEQMFLIERYRHPRTAAMGDISACRAGGQDAGQALLACARELGAKVSCETVTGITSLSDRQASPAGLLTRNRDHWGIENGLHHRRDTSG